jgi:hypothetical protein
MSIFTFLASFFIAVQIVDSRLCTARCTLQYSMDQPFIIPDDTQCKRDTHINCEAMVTLDYFRRTYTVHFPDNIKLILSNSDYIQITSGPEFLYTIKRTCWNTDDCALEYMKGRILEMVARAYNVFGIVGDLSKILTEPLLPGLPETSLGCYYDTYQTSGNTGPCLSNNGRRGRCLINYNQWSHVIRSQECERSDNNTIAVNVYDSESKYTALELACKKDFCNTKSTVDEVIRILAQYNLTDASGGTGRGAANRLIASLCLVGFALLFSRL